MQNSKEKTMKSFKELDPVLHSQLRLAVMSILITVKEAEFSFLKEKTEATAGNLSVQIQKLKDAGYIEVEKKFRDNYPLTICRVTKTGVKAFQEYVEALQAYIGKKK
jgi:DNA-binding transcriptional ArsR family regulator